jgi:phage I-like protein
MGMIVRLAASAAIEKLFKKKTEETDDSPMETLDQLMDAPGYKYETLPEIREEDAEKHLDKSKTKDIIKDIHNEKGEIKRNEKSNIKESSGHQGETNFNSR